MNYSSLYTAFAKPWSNVAEMCDSDSEFAGVIQLV